MQARFYFDWMTKQTVWVEVGCNGYSTVSGELYHPTIQFFESKHGHPIRIFYQKEQFKAILDIGYHMIVNGTQDREATI